MNYQGYEIWHDEYRGGDSVNEYWHGILFIPTVKLKKIKEIIKKIREEHGYGIYEDVKFSKTLNGGKKKKRYMQNIMTLFQHLLIVKKNQAYSEFLNRTGKQIYNKTFDPFFTLNGVFDCKFALLKIPDNHKSFNYFSEYAKKVETTFRFIFKNACHSFFSERNSVLIEKLYFDGKDHHRRDYNLKAMIPSDLRSYCRVVNNIPIDDRSMRERNDDTKIIMSFVDNIIGGLTAKINGLDNSDEVLSSLGKLYKRILENKIFSNKHGRWYKSIITSEVYIENNQVIFPEMF